MNALDAHSLRLAELAALVARIIAIGTVTAVSADGSVDVAWDPDAPDGGPVSAGLVNAQRRAGDTRTSDSPSEGEQVLCVAPGGDLDGAIVIASLTTAANPAPGNAAGQLATRAKDGATFLYDPAAHALTITLPAKATARIAAPGGTTVDGDLTVTGNIAVDGTVDGVDVAGHKHAKNDPSIPPTPGATGPPL